MKPYEVQGYLSTYYDRHDVGNSNRVRGQFSVHPVALVNGLVGRDGLARAREWRM